MITIFCLFLIFLVNSNMAFVKLESEYPSHQISRYNERQQRFLRNLMGKLIDTRTSAIYNVEGQKQHSIATVPSSKFVEDLACLEACYTCVEEFPVIPVRISRISIDCSSWFFFSNSSTREKHRIIVVHCAIVLIAALVYRSNRSINYTDKANQHVEIKRVFGKLIFNRSIMHYHNKNKHEQSIYSSISYSFFSSVIL